MPFLTPERYRVALHKSPVVLNALLHGLSQEQAQALTDGPGGWSVVETMCHIRDFADISLIRVQRILAEDGPTLPNMDPLEGAQRRDYRQQSLAAEFAAYLEARKALLALLDGLTDAQWERWGTHTKFGRLTLAEMAGFIAWHDLDHTEQIARTLKLAETLV